MRLFLNILFIVLFLVTNIAWIWQGPVARKNKEASRLYSEGKVDEALSEWRDAQIEDPESSELHYNIGNALHGQEKYEEAFNEYEKSLGSKDAEFQSRTYYNMGNTHYRMGKLKEAIEDYKRCLDLDPDDEDAKYNIEFVRRKIKENLEKQQAAQEEMREEEGEEGESQQQQQQAQQAEGEEEEETGEKGQEAAEEEEGEDEKQESAEGQQTREEERPEGASDEKEMSEEDALRLLDALKDDEKDLQKELRTQQGEGRYRVDKDW